MDDVDQQPLAGVTDTRVAQAPACVPDPLSLETAEGGATAVDRASLADEMKRAEGSACIYIEQGTVMLATIEHIATLADDVVIALLDCGCPGFTPPIETPMGSNDGRFKVGAACSEGQFGGTLWRGSPYCPWAIHIDQFVVSKLRDFAALLVGKPRRKRSALLRQRLRDEQYGCLVSAETRLARVVQTTAREVLAGQDDFLRGTRDITRAFDKYSLAEEHPDFSIFLELGEKTRGELALPREWRDPANPRYEELRQLALPYEARVLAAFRHLAEKCPEV
jgi:hypothetical protein